MMMMIYFCQVFMMNNWVGCFSCKLKPDQNHKCSQRDIDTVLNGGRVKRARVRPVVTAFQDLCLGAPLSDLLLWETQQKKQNRTEQDGTASPMGHSAKK